MLSPQKLIALIRLGWLVAPMIGLGVRSLPAVSPDTLQPTGDEFDEAATLPRWRDLNVVERWQISQLEALDIHTTVPGHMRLVPRTSSWFNNLKGVLIHKEVSGDFVATAHLRVFSRHNPADPTEPPGRRFSLAGIFARAPRPVFHGAPEPYTTQAVWPPQDFGSDWTPDGENYVFLSFGSAGNPGTRQFEIKATRNSDSRLYYSTAGVPQAGADSNEVWLQMVRVRDTVVCLRCHPGGPWIVENRYPNPVQPLPYWGQVLQVGITAYTDWDAIEGTYFTNTGNPQNQFWHNYTVISGGNAQPDLVAEVDYLRFERPHPNLTESALAALPVSFTGNPAPNQGSTPTPLPPTGAGQFLGDAANTPLGKLTLGAAPTVREGRAAHVTITRTGSGPVFPPVNVSYIAMSGTAESGADFDVVTAPASWPDNEGPIVVPVATIWDDVIEGNETFAFEVRDVHGPATLPGGLDSASIELTIEDHPFDIWRRTYFPLETTANSPASVRGADPDNDGLSNVLEFALVGDPLVGGDAARLPALSVVPGPGAGTIEITFRTRDALSGLRYELHGSADLESWDILAFRPEGSNQWTVDSPDVDGIESGPNDGDTVRIRLNYGAGRRFHRVAVSVE